MYDNYESQWTMNRAAYGDTAATMMASQSGRGGGGGYPSGDMDPLARVGAMIRPIQYTPPAQVTTGFYGMQQMPTGFIRSATALAFGNTPQGMYTLDHDTALSRDFGGRLAHGAMGAGLAVGGLAVGGAVSTVLRAGLTMSMGAGILGMGASSAIQDAIVQRSAMSDFLGQTSYRFVGAGNPMADARLGRGMSVSARREATEYIRGMEVKDPYLNMEDMSNILSQSVSSGMLNGTKDMDDFKRKFKDITEAVKVVTKTLGQTLEEGVKTLRDLKSIGVDPSQAKSLVTSAGAMGMVAGRTASEMVGIGLQGAETFRGTGITMGIGMQGTMMNLSSIRAARDAGLISSESVAQMGGEEAMAMRQTAQGLAFAQSGTGRGFNATFFNNGAFDAKAFKASMSEDDSIADLARKAAGNLASPAQLIKYQANQAKAQSEEAAQYGGRGLEFSSYKSAMASAKMLSESTGASMQDAFKLTLMQQNNLTEVEADQRIAQIKGAGAIYKKQMAGAYSMMQKQQVEEAEQSRFFNRIGSKASDAVSRVVDVVAKPAWAAVEDAAESVSKSITQAMYGVENVSLSGMDLGVSPEAMARAAGVKQKINLNEGGVLGVTAGEAVNDFLTKSGGRWARRLGIDRYKDGGNIELTKGMSITSEDLDKMDELKKWVTGSEASKADKIQGPSIGVLGRSGKLDGLTERSSIEAIAQSVLGAKVDNYMDLSREDMTRVRQTVEGTSLAKAFIEHDKSIAQVSQIKDQAASKSIIDAKKDRDTGIKELTKLVGGSAKFSDDVMGKMTRLADMDPESEEYQALRAEITSAHMKSDADTDVNILKRQIDTAISIGTAKEEDGTSRLQKIGTNTAHLVKGQRELSGNRFLSVADSQLKGSGATYEERLENTAVLSSVLQADNVTSYTKLVEQHSSALKKTSAGKRLMDISKTIGKFTDKDTDTKTAQLMITDLKGTIGEKMAESLSEEVEKGGDRTAIANKLLKGIKDSTNPESIMLSQGGKKGVQGTEGLAVEAYNRTAQIQLETLHALEALNSRMPYGR